jgi:TatD DNase family protein
VTSNSSLRLVDTHCHLNFDAFDRDRLYVVERARENGISRILNPGIDIETSKAALKCSVDYSEVYAAVGVHPNSGLSWTITSLSELRQLAGEQKVLAIGEIGLDYYREYTPRELQRSIFSKQLELAADLILPVIIHNREAFEDILDILTIWYRALLISKSKLAHNPGVMHSFSGTVEFAKACTSLNFKIGISGPVTFRNSQVLQSVVCSLPLESLLIETDAPYLTPHPYRGKRNEPANVRIVAEKIAELKAYPVDEVASITTEEAHKLFNWRVIS